VYKSGLEGEKAVLIKAFMASKLMAEGSLIKQ
jgi:hypothetical protein